MNKKTVTILAGAVLAVLAVAGCNGQNAQQKEQAAQQADTSSLINNQPIPHFNWSQYRQTLIDAEQIAASGTQTTSFFFNQGVRDPIFSCPSLGLFIPVTSQLSNPEQITPVTSRWGGGHDILPQMDPFGAYTAPDATGTYVVCVNSSGKPYLFPWEGFVGSVTAPAVWDYGTHTVKVTGAPTFSVKTSPTK